MLPVCQIASLPVVLSKISESLRGIPPRLSDSAVKTMIAYLRQTNKEHDYRYHIISLFQQTR
jgi:hypothetical protein